MALRRQAGRFVKTPDQARQAKSQTASFLFVQKAANFATPTIRLDSEATGRKWRATAVHFNLCPVPRKYQFCPELTNFFCHGHLILIDDNALTVKASLQIGSQGPAKQQHFKSRKRQHGPESLGGKKPCDREGDQTNRGEKQLCTARCKGAVGANLDGQGGGIHVGGPRLRRGKTPSNSSAWTASGGCCQGLIASGGRCSLCVR